MAKTGDACEWRAPIRVKPDVKRVSGGYRVSFTVSPRSAMIHATFDGSDPKLGPVVSSADIEAPPGATHLRAIAEVGGQFSEEESAPLQSGVSEAGGAYTANRPPLKLDAPANMTSRFEPKDTAAAFSALDRLAKAAGARILGGSVEVNGMRSEHDFLTLRLGRDVPILARRSRRFCEGACGNAQCRRAYGEIAPRRYRIFRLDGDLTAFCDDVGEDFDRVTWKQD